MRFWLKSVVISVGLTIGSVLVQAQSPPTEARIKKDVMNPGVIAIIFRGPGSFEKYVTDGAVVSEYYRSITVRRKTDRPGITVDVLGDVVYRLIGGRWVYRTMRIAENTYGGFQNPTISELNEALKAGNLSEFNSGNKIIGEYESLRLADAPNWEWHTPNSVSFYVIAVYRVANSYLKFENAPTPPVPAGFGTVDKVQQVLRLRIYRKDEKSPWSNVLRTTVTALEIPDAKGKMFSRSILLERKTFRFEEIQKMPRMTKVPQLVQ